MATKKTTKDFSLQIMLYFHNLCQRYKDIVSSPFSKSVEFYFSIQEASPFQVDCDVTDGAELAKQLLLAIAEGDPLFAYTCLSEERYQRNRVTTKQGVNTIESWVRRDIRKRIPGLCEITEEYIDSKKYISYKGDGLDSEEFIAGPGRSGGT